ncbi:MAG: ABC transporter ATP-binding protein [Candidatus Acidiferrales bacterium]
MTSEATTTITAQGAAGIAPGGQQALLRVEGLRKVFRSGGTEVTALDGVSLAISSGEMVALVGPSGSGKSTLLHLLAALDTPTSGTVYFDGNLLEALGERDLENFRSSAVGFVWQRHQLLSDFTAAENVAMPLLIRGAAARDALQTAREWLGEVGLADRSQHRASELSGGEQQRVAIARALVSRPKVLLADEPTGDLDEANTESIFGLLQRLHRSHHLTSILATHNLSLAGRADRVLSLEHGLLAQGNRTFTRRASGRAASGMSSAPEGLG